MNVLWAGAEDIDFPTPGQFAPSTTAATFRSGWARCSITGGTNISSVTSPGFSQTFTGGAVTSAWLSFRVYQSQIASTGNLSYCSFGLQGTNNALGVGVDATAVKIVLFKYDGTTRTVLATEGGTSIIAGSTMRFDMQVLSYGASATVNVYFNGTSVISFTGDVTVSGQTNVNCVTFPKWTGGGTTFGLYYSEIFVGDSDTRAVQGLQTLALTGNGTTNSWTNNTYTNINAVNFSDSNPTLSNTAAQDQQYTVTTPTPTTYSVIAVSISGRLARPATSTTTQLKLGYKNGATGSFGTGAAKSPGVSFTLFTQIDATNPVTGVAFTSSDLSSLQLDMQSA